MPRPDSKRTPLAKVRAVAIRQSRKRKQLYGIGA
jgi:hypothetical protein